ncbi:MAG TPA: FkbM family methyltransferase [Methanoregula sp.]|nr:FkbM family methyltransferase [Methanoregula sp.]
MPGHHFPGTEPDFVFSTAATPYRKITSVTEYRFDDIRPGDRVLDIGANVGGFCIRAARMSGHVTAVEPVTTPLLLENISANNVAVQVIGGALGDGKPKEICWDDCRVVAPTYPLRTLIAMSGGCDFLKCDCEGAEWLINPAELDGVRRIEMEIHLPPISGPPAPALLEYISRFYDFEIERKPCHDVLGVMGVLHAERK